MEIADIVGLVTNNGVAIAVVVYFLWRDNKFNKTQIETLTSVKNLISDVKQIVLTKKINELETIVNAKE